MKKTYIIAEIGINHNGSLDIAKKLIDVAAVAGCDAVKFQKRNPDVCVPEHQKQKIRETPWGNIPYIDYKYKVEFEKEEYDEIDRYCKERGIDWSASPWDLDSLNFLDQYDIPFIKIPSAMLTNEELIKKTAQTGKKIILSTGMSTMEEINQAVVWLMSEQADFALLHCNSAYPAPLEDLNLSCIKTLKDIYKCEVGYSGHEFRLGTTVAAVYLGATILERHITLDRSMWGSDHLSSIEPQGLIKLVRGVRELEVAFGDGVKRVTDGELPSRKKLRGS
tara:strand:+ start:2496 stop:3329 length:834 start_codon:yes stop_codon:yes gene_type:complete